jgi:hypothetical protein
MTRRQWLSAITRIGLLGFTLPLTALICLGHSPSRYASRNIPYWERRVPDSIPWRMHLRSCDPASVQTILCDEPLLSEWRGGDSNPLFSYFVRQYQTGSGRRMRGVGLELEQACVFGRRPAWLSMRQDRLALELMNTQSPDGWLGATHPRRLANRSACTAFRHSVGGLLTYYNLTRNPAALQAAMRAGDFVLSESNDGCIRGSADEFVLPMARLYQATGDRRYLSWAVDESANTNDLPGLCALYAITDDGIYLHRAQVLWRRKQPTSPEDREEWAAALLGVTDDLRAAAVLSSGAGPWFCPINGGTVAYDMAPGMIRINIDRPSQFVCRLAKLSINPTTASRSDNPEMVLAIADYSSRRLVVHLPPGCAASGPYSGDEIVMDRAGKCRLSLLLPDHAPAHRSLLSKERGGEVVTERT